MFIGRFCLLLAVAILVSVPSISQGITLGQVDTFEDGTTQGWYVDPAYLDRLVMGGTGWGQRSLYSRFWFYLGRDRSGGNRQSTPMDR